MQALIDQHIQGHDTALQQQEGYVALLQHLEDTIEDHIGYSWHNFNNLTHFAQCLDIANKHLTTYCAKRYSEVYPFSFAA